MGVGVTEMKRGRKWKRRKKKEGIGCWSRERAAVCGRGEGRKEKGKKMGRRPCCPPKERREKERRKEKEEWAFGQNNGAALFVLLLSLY
jgi:hypothetical protein